MPEEAQARLDAELGDQQRDHYKGSMIAIAIYAPVITAGVFAAGLRNEVPAIVSCVLSGLALFAGYCAMRARDPLHPAATLLHTGSIALTFVPLAMVFSPIIVLPVFLTVNTVLCPLFSG